MEMRPLGDTGVRVSLLGLGAVKLGRTTGLKYPGAFTLPTDAEVRHLLAEAHELGVNLIDTAPAYGESEARIGAWLPGRREDWVLSTKVGEIHEPGRSRFDFSAAHTRASIERSLANLRTDHLDIVLVHSDGDDLAIIEHGDCLDALLRLKAEGRVRCIGFSGKTLAGALAALRTCDVVMLTLSPRARAEEAVVAAAARAGRGVLVKKALDSGHLDAQARARHFEWLRTLPGIASVVVGTLSPQHLRENARLLGCC
jgi:aryl-alcohol dehydrogenase-like predicted oxidoreductase